MRDAVRLTGYPVSGFCRSTKWSEGDLVRKSLVNTWVLVVGDSVARMAYAALLALFNGTDPAFGWPTHRVSSGDCVEHVVTADAERFRMDVPHCTMRWKGICHERGFGNNLEDYYYCWLDYLVASTGVRLTFLWHTVNRAANLQELSMRVRTLKQAAGRASPARRARAGLRKARAGLRRARAGLPPEPCAQR